MTNSGVLGKTVWGKVIGVGIATAMVLAVTAVPARAQAKAEFGVSFANLTVGLGDNDFTTFGIPSSAFGLVTPGVYASIFAGTNMSIDPKVGLIVVSGGGDTDHILSLGGQVNYFMNGTDASSPFLFGEVGLITESGDESITTFGGGAGYRKLLGERLVIRTEAKLVHFSDGGGNALVATVSLGGLFGKK